MPDPAAARTAALVAVGAVVLMFLGGLVRWPDPRVAPRHGTGGVSASS